MLGRGDVRSYRYLVYAGKPEQLEKLLGDWEKTDISNQKRIVVEMRKNHFCYNPFLYYGCLLFGS